jgi:hypothetical protein
MYSVDEKRGGGEDLGSMREKRREERIIVESS